MNMDWKFPQIYNPYIATLEPVLLYFPSDHARKILKTFTGFAL